MPTGIYNHSSQPVSERFWHKVDKSGGANACWPWTGYVKANGYGRISAGRRGAGMLHAHRVSFELSNGPIPIGFAVCHHCDNRRCCNPAHLFLGTQADNLADMKAKGRKRYGTSSGDSNGNSKLTESQIVEIRQTGGPHHKIAAKYNVSRAHISRIIKCETRRTP